MLQEAMLLWACRFHGETKNAFCETATLKTGDGSITLISNLREQIVRNGRWLELAQDHIQCWTLVLAVLNIQILIMD
jgi:hypothetical protein